MFDTLSSKLQNAFRNLRGLGKISESNVSDSLREVRMALLEADVNFKVARDFIERVKTKSIGAEVVQSVQPGQQIIKIINDELVDLLGSQNAALNLGGSPTSILMVGLHGSGKTTSSGKLARLLQRQGRQPLLVAADVYRPAAMDQLETLGKQIEIPVFLKRGETDVLKIAREAMDFARAQSRNVIIFDTAVCKLTNRWCRNSFACATSLSRKRFYWCSTPPPARKRSMWRRISTRRCKSPVPF